MDTKTHLHRPLVLPDLPETVLSFQLSVGNSAVPQSAKFGSARDAIKDVIKRNLGALGIAVLAVFNHGSIADLTEAQFGRSPDFRGRIH